MKREPDWIKALTDQSRIMGPRVLRDDQPFSLQGAAEVIRRLLEHLDQVKKSQGWAALAMGETPARLNAAINGDMAQPETVIRNADKWLEAQALKEQTARPSGFVRTGVAEKIWTAGRYAARARAMALVTGPAGIGKSMAASALAQDLPGTVCIRINAVGITSIAVLEALAAALGRKSTSRWTASQLYAFCETALRDTGRLVIIDECHRLASRRRDEALHVLRDLHDSAGVPMLLLGMVSIKDYILAGQSKGECLAQLASRISLFLDLEEDTQGEDGGRGGRQMTTVEDVRKFLAARQIRITPSAERYLLSLVNAYGAGAFRAVERLLEMAAMLARGEVITEEMLRGCQMRRLGMHAAEALESRMAVDLVKGVA